MTKRLPEVFPRVSWPFHITTFVSTFQCDHRLAWEPLFPIPAVCIQSPSCLSFLFKVQSKNPSFLTWRLKRKLQKAFLLLLQFVLFWRGVGYSCSASVILRFVTPIGIEVGGITHWLSESQEINTHSLLGLSGQEILVTLQDISVIFLRRGLGWWWARPAATRRFSIGIMQELVQLEGPAANEADGEDPFEVSVFSPSLCYYIGCIFLKERNRTEYLN